MPRMRSTCDGRNRETNRLGSAGRNLGLPGVDTEDDKTPH
jgi:hypothetical protein